MQHPRHAGVYAIRHIESGRAYIGSAKNIYSRWRVHKSDLRRGTHHCHYLQNAWRKYGEEAFAFDVLETCFPDIVMLRHREEAWLKRVGDTRFNASDKAEASTQRPRTPEQRAAMSAKMMGNKNGAFSHYHGKLTESDIVSIFHRYAAGEELIDIASSLKVSYATITRIISRSIWWRVEIDRSVEEACQKRIGSRQRGEENGRSKLTWPIVEIIRTRHAAGESMSSLAREFGVSPAAVSAIVTGRTWSKPPEEPLNVPIPIVSTTDIEPSPLIRKKRSPQRKQFVSRLRPAKVSVRCEACQKELFLSPSRARRHSSHYCSKACRRDGQSRRVKKMMEDPVVRERIAKTNTGRKASPETRAKMSASQKRRQASQRYSNQQAQFTLQSVCPTIGNEPIGCQPSSDSGGQSSQ